MRLLRCKETQKLGVRARHSGTSLQSQHFWRQSRFGFCQSEARNTFVSHALYSLFQVSIHQRFWANQGYDRVAVTICVKKISSRRVLCRLKMLHTEEASAEGAKAEVVSAAWRDVT